MANAKRGLSINPLSYQLKTENGNKALQMKWSQSHFKKSPKTLKKTFLRLKITHSRIVIVISFLLKT